MAPNVARTTATTTGTQGTTTNTVVNPPFDPKDKIIIVTGGGSGIGSALCRAFATAGAAVIVVVDIDGDAAQRVGRDITTTTTTPTSVIAVPKQVDVSQEANICRLIDEVEEQYGPVNLFVANAGVLAWRRPPTSSSSSSTVVTTPASIFPDWDDWQRVMAVNTMQLLYAAKHLIPRFLQRRSSSGSSSSSGGHLMVTASAAGLLTQIGSVSYSVSKAAVVALAEYLAITYGGLHNNNNIGVCCVCPQLVTTDMTTTKGVVVVPEIMGQAVSPEYVAQCSLEGLRRGRFLVLPHPEVARYEQRKAKDRDAWIVGMRRLNKIFVDVVEQQLPLPPPERRPTSRL